MRRTISAGGGDTGLCSVSTHWSAVTRLPHARRAHAAGGATQHQALLVTGRAPPHRLQHQRLCLAARARGCRCVSGRASRARQSEARAPSAALGSTSMAAWSAAAAAAARTSGTVRPARTGRLSVSAAW
jgi:hypothetical protein